MIRNDQLLYAGIEGKFDEHRYGQEVSKGDTAYYSLTISWEEQLLVEMEHELVQSRSIAELTGIVGSLAALLYARLVGGALADGLCADEAEIVQVVSDYFQDSPKTIQLLRTLGHQAEQMDGAAACVVEAGGYAELYKLAAQLLRELRASAALGKEAAFQ